MFIPTTVLMDAPFRLVRDEHYVAVRTSGKTERIEFGRNLPLTKRAAMQYVKSTGHIGDFRVIMRKTARKAGLI